MGLELGPKPCMLAGKMWDWHRLGLDGTPRPIHLAHGPATSHRDRTTEWTRCKLVNRNGPAATRSASIQNGTA